MHCEGEAAFAPASFQPYLAACLVGGTALLEHQFPCQMEGAVAEVGTYFDAEGDWMAVVYGKLTAAVVVVEGGVVCE